jgi:hypothetical protein
MGAARTAKYRSGVGSGLGMNGPNPGSDISPGTEDWQVVRSYRLFRAVIMLRSAAVGVCRTLLKPASVSRASISFSE